MCRVLLIDNYDSFTYNLVHAVAAVDSQIEVIVRRNDEISVEEAAALDPTHLIISPGPCTPRESGVSPLLIAYFEGRIPILGVCLGHQAIAELHGMTVRRHGVLMHGKTSLVHHDGRGIFQHLPNPITAARYHSLIVDRSTLSDEFEVSAWTQAGEIMGLRSRRTLTDGVQFHPESFMTPDGNGLLANFLAQRTANHRDVRARLHV